MATVLMIAFIREPECYMQLRQKIVACRVVRSGRTFGESVEDAASRVGVEKREWGPKDTGHYTVVD